MLAISLILALVLTAVDQLIKLWVVNNYEQCISFVRRYYTFSIGEFDVFSFTHIRNDGAGWSILGGQTVFLIVLTSVLMIAILAYMVIKRKSMHRFETLCLAMILSGGVGNLIDRIRMLVQPDFDGVIDYIVFDFINFPVFNFADMCVVIGGIGFCAFYIILEIKEAKQKKSNKPISCSSNNNDQI